MTFLFRGRMDAGDGEDIEVLRQPRLPMSMTAIGVITTHNACLGSDLLLGPLACRSRVCESGGIGWLVRYQLELFGSAQNMEYSAPAALSGLRLHAENMCLCSSCQRIRRKQCQVHTHRLGQTLGL